MHRRALVTTALVLLGATSCTTHEALPVAHAKAPTMHASAVSAAPAPPTETSSAPPLAATPRCVLSSPKKDVPVPLLAGAACHATPTDLQAAVRLAITKRYEKEDPHGWPRVTFGCDGLGPRIREIAVEAGEGHGFDLKLWRARLAEDGSHYDVRGIAYAEDGYVRLPVGEPHYRLASGQLRRAVLAPGIERARAAIAASVEEVVPPDPDRTSFHGMSMSFSSEDFHVLVSLTDTDGRTVEKEFTGYRSSGDQNQFLPPDLAAEGLGIMTTAFPFLVTEPTDADRGLFAERFHDARDRFDEDFHWWVTERLVALSIDLGSPAVTGDLLTRLKLGVDDRSKVEARANALEALARITGWDARVDETGHPRDAETASRSYLDECGEKGTRRQEDRKTGEKFGEK